MRVFVDQAVEDRFSADLLCVDVGHGSAERVTVAVGDTLRDTLVRPGRVVVHLIFREDVTQVRLAEDQRPVEDFAAQSADKALASARAGEAGALERARLKFPAAAIEVLEFTGTWQELGPERARLTTFVVPRELRAGSGEG
jgi:hypothetical protein